MTYEIRCSADIGEAIDSVKDILKSVNVSLADFGVNERVKMISDFNFGELNVNRELTKQEIEEIKTLIDAEFIKNQTLHKYHMRVTSITKKGGEQKK